MERTGEFIAADGTTIWYGTVGRGPALVLCDGFACDGFIWPYVVDHFCEDYTVVRWHYRGHGLSDNPVETTRVSVSDLCQDLHGLLQQEGIDEAILAGHSMGVQVILQHYGLFPDDVRALIPICGTYKRPLDTFHDTDALHSVLPLLSRAVAAAPDKVQAIWQALTQPTKASYLIASLRDINAKLARREDFLPYLEHVANMDVRVFTKMLEKLSDHDTEHILPSIDVPTLVIAGEHDTFTPLYRSEELVRAVPLAELLILPSGTHIGPLELPDLVNASIEKFLRKRL